MGSGNCAVFFSIMSLTMILQPAFAGTQPIPKGALRLDPSQLQVQPITVSRQARAAGDLILDDGLAEDFHGVNDATDGHQFLWLNRFSPMKFPVWIDSIMVVFGDTAGHVGGPIQLVVYTDTDGDGDPSNAVLERVYDEIVQQDDGVTWNAYPLNPPLFIPGPGDVLIGVINRYQPGTGYGVLDDPAAMDTSTSQQRSWAGWWTASQAPDPPLIPPDAFFETVDISGIPGNWLIQGLVAREEISETISRIQFSVGPAQNGMPWPTTGLAPFGLRPPFVFPSTAVFDEQTLTEPPLLPPPVQIPDSADDDVYEYGTNFAPPMMNYKIVDDGYPIVPPGPPSTFGTGMFPIPPGAQPPPPQATIPTDSDNINALAVESEFINFADIPGIFPALVRDMFFLQPPYPLYLQFSVDNDATGLPNTAVAAQAFWREATGDVFEACVLFPIGSNAQIADEMILGLADPSSVPPGGVDVFLDDTDAMIVTQRIEIAPGDFREDKINWDMPLDPNYPPWIDTNFNTPGLPDTPHFFFSVDRILPPLGGSCPQIFPADILIPGSATISTCFPAVPPPWPPAQPFQPDIFLTHANLGLLPDDNIDALFVDQSAGFVVFSLAKGSPSLADPTSTVFNPYNGFGFGADPGDIIFVQPTLTVPAIPPEVVLLANEIGLRGNQLPDLESPEDDELNAMWVTPFSLIDDMSPPIIVSDPLPQVACLGDSVSFVANAAGGRSLVYRWYKDAQPTEVYGRQLIIASVTSNDFGTYHCEVSNCFGLAQTTVAALDRGPLQIDVMPHAEARGLCPVTFDPSMDCAIANVDVLWYSKPVDQAIWTQIKHFTNPPYTLTVYTDPPMPTSSTQYRAEVTDSVGNPSLSQTRTQDVILLVAAHPDYFDYHDPFLSCNDINDLYKLLPEWRTEKTTPIPDPSGDGFVDIRDTLYINITCSCP